MDNVVIENPVINSPYDEPRQHFRFDETGITSEVVEGRRPSEHTIAVAGTRRRGRQLALQGQLAQEQLQPNAFVNRVRDQVALWRRGGYQGVTRTTRRLLEYWRDPERERKFFFCQIEALETAVFIHEVAGRYGQAWIENDLRRFSEESNPGLYRLALKMATGSGKTVVMAMLIAWQALNKIENPQDRRFSDAFLVVTPGITIRDRLRVLQPEEPDNYYDQRGVVPDDLRERLRQAKIHILNYHQFLPRQTVDAPRLTKIIASGGNPEAYVETPDDVARRVLRDLGAKRGIVVLNDEAHHCYRHRVQDAIEEKLSGEERQEASRREEEARVWISGLEAMQQRAGIRLVYDLSATPFFLRGSGYPEGTLFQWVVSDFGLIDAIESGIVKVPRVPVDDDQMDGAVPTYRELWSRISADLPKKGRATKAVTGDPDLPGELEGALHSLYGNYRKYHARWEAGETGETPPVFIVVCNNTNVSKLVYDWIAGYDRELADGKTVVHVPGKLDLFSNIRDGEWLARPNTILIDSAQLESGEAMSADFKRAAAREIEEFKAELRRRSGAGTEAEVTDEDLLREVMNTVGKPGRLGEQVKCVVSVSMLTEGWDANTVTHILGVRAFGTQLLCEQVVGRALRRVSYVPGEDGLFPPEYAEVYGVPFSFIPTNGVVREQPPRTPPTLIRALPEREGWEIRFPNVAGYRYDLVREQLEVEWARESRFTLTPRILPTVTELAPIVGESSIHTLDDLKKLRMPQVEFQLARLVMERFFRQDGQVEAWFFPQVLDITRRWIAECVDEEDHGFPQMLFISEMAHHAAERIHGGIMRGHTGDALLKPILNHYNPEGSTRFVQLETRRETYRTKAKCHLSHVIVDSGWEAKLAQALEEMPEVLAYAKNQGVNLRIPYTIGGVEREYVPDFIAIINDGHGAEDPLHLLLEVSGQERLDKETKVEAAETLWVPAVNNAGTHGRWGFLEITNPWAAQQHIRAHLAARAEKGAA